MDRRALEREIIRRREAGEDEDEEDFWESVEFHAGQASRKRSKSEGSRMPLRTD